MDNDGRACELSGPSGMVFKIRGAQNRFYLKPLVKFAAQKSPFRRARGLPNAKIHGRGKAVSANPTVKMNASFKKIAQILLFFGIGTGLLYLVYHFQNAAFQEQCRLDGTPADRCSLWEKIKTDFASVNYWWIFGVVAAFTVSNFCRAARWQQLIEPLGHRASFGNAFWTIQLGYFANLGFPRAGEVVRATSFARVEKVPIERVMGTLVVDRLMDFVCLALVLGIGLLVEGGTMLDFISSKTGGSGGSVFGNPVVLGLLGAAVLGGSVFFVFRKKIAQLALFQRVMLLAKGFSDGLRSVFRLKNPGLFLFFSGTIWVCYFLQTWFGLHSFGPTAHLPTAAALTVFIFGTLGIVVPSPGGMGTYHLLAIAALSIYGVNGGDGFSWANIMFFSIQVFYMVLMGCAALIVLPVINRNKKPD